MADILVRNGFIVDGSGQPGFPGEVAVTGDRIEAVGPSLSLRASRVLDAGGRIVIPGLIDPHVHEEYVCLLDGRMELFLRQGVTTCLNGNCGHSLFSAPRDQALRYYWLNGLISEAQRDQYRALFPPWEDFSGYAAFWKQRGCNINMAFLQGHGTLRWLVMDGAHDRKPSDREAARIEALLRQGMQQGAWGVSFGLSYVPSRYADTDELCQVVDVIREYDGVAAAHLRHHIGMLPCTEEFLEVGRRTGARIQVSHLKPVCPECFDAVQRAAREGVRVLADTIPASTGHLTRKDRALQFITAVSDSLFDGGIAGVLEALRTPQGRATVLKDAYFFPEDRSQIFLVNCEDSSLEGRSVASIARERGQDPNETLLNLLADEKQCTFYLGGPSRPDFPVQPHARSIVENPYVCVGSDELMGDPQDPGAWYELLRRGAMPIFWQMYRDAGVPLEEIVRRNTSMPAGHLGIPGRGLLASGHYADIAILDPENFSYPPVDRIDCRRTDTLASGVDTVLVNGMITLENGRLVNPMGGRILLHGREGNEI